MKVCICITLFSGLFFSSAEAQEGVPSRSWIVPGQSRPPSPAESQLMDQRWSRSLERFLKKSDRATSPDQDPLMLSLVDSFSSVSKAAKEGPSENQSCSLPNNPVQAKPLPQLEGSYFCEFWGLGKLEGISYGLKLENDNPVLGLFRGGDDRGYTHGSNLGVTFFGSEADLSFSQSSKLYTKWRRQVADTNSSGWGNWGGGGLGGSGFNGDQSTDRSDLALDRVVPGVGGNGGVGGGGIGIGGGGGNGSGGGNSGSQGPGKSQAPIHFLEINRVECRLETRPDSEGYFKKFEVGLNHYTTTGIPLGARNQQEIWHDALDIVEYNYDQGIKINRLELTCRADIGKEWRALDGHCYGRAAMGAEASTIWEHSALVGGLEAGLTTAPADGRPRFAPTAELVTGFECKQYIDGERDSFAYFGAGLSQRIGNNCFLKLTGSATIPIEQNESMFSAFHSSLGGMKDDEPIYGIGLQMILGF